MLGYTGVQKYRTYDFVSTKGIIWLTNLGCTGTEMSIDNRGHAGNQKPNCYHSHNVGVSCKMGKLVVTQHRFTVTLAQIKIYCSRKCCFARFPSIEPMSDWYDNDFISWYREKYII